MSISWILLCGLFLTLLTTRMGATPLLRSQRNLADLLGEEFSEDLSSTDTEDAVAVNAKVRLLRDLRSDTRSKSTWVRLLNDYNNPRKIRGKKRKGSSKGCFGRKLDRIGAMSNLGC
ncbi:C-type natriuretic peptide 4-like [Scyliorhinus canicula]|uniref:C-type natriuretic peptide 4-like n=1 Tax=Scyliorhinus canicula TaxID=7830 RepID=UPI0018F6AE60|nr:C-type natriuretic peptide 4-like [Scyliorhinus canicula]